MLVELKQILHKCKHIYTLDEPILDLNIYSWIIRNEYTLILLQYNKNLNDWNYQHYGKNMRLYESDDSDNENHYQIYFIFDIDSFLQKYKINKKWDSYLAQHVINDKIDEFIQDFENAIEGYKYDPGKKIVNLELESIQPNQLNNVFQKVYIIGNEKQTAYRLRLIDELKRFHISNYMFMDKEKDDVKQIMIDALNNKYERILMINENVIFHKNFVTEIRKICFPNNSKIISLGKNDFNGESSGFYKISPNSEKDLFSVIIDKSVFEEILITGDIKNIINTYTSNCYYYLPSLVKC